jgi:ADP-ribosyl-[dinitrogen reductase] hydrolase
MDKMTLDRLCGCAVGAAVGDALGMPLEFGPPKPADKLVRLMVSGRLPAGSFTDDTEMALALADSLLAHRPLDGDDLAQHFVSWIQRYPPDVGIQTAQVLGRIARGESWQAIEEWMTVEYPNSAGNGSLMRCWPAALAWWNDRPQLVNDSRLQSRLTHPHPECVAGCIFVNSMIAEMVNGASPRTAFESTCKSVSLPDGLYQAVMAAPQRHREDLPNTGWVRHTLESALWGLLTTGSFEEALVQVVNLGGDADTAGAVTGALAGAAYGIVAIPKNWRGNLHGEWPLGSQKIWHEVDFIELARRLAMI